MWINTTLRSSHLTHNGHHQDTNDHRCWYGCGDGVGMEKGTLRCYCWKTTLVQPLWTSIWKFLNKTEIALPYDPVVSLLGLYPEDFTSFSRDTCTSIFIAALLTTARKWNLKMPASWWRVKEIMAHVHTGVLLSCEEKWNHEICR